MSDRFSQRLPTRIGHERQIIGCCHAPATLSPTCVLTPTLTFIQPAGAINLPQTGPIFFDAALYHPAAVVQTPVVTLSMIDPAGIETVLYGPTSIVLAPNDLIILYGVQFFLPTVNPAYLNLPFLIRLRANDAATAIELDHDEYQFFIQ